MADAPSPGLEHEEARAYQIHQPKPEDPFLGRGRLHGLSWRPLEVAWPWATQTEKNTIETLWETNIDLLEWTIDIDGTTETVRFTKKPTFQSISAKRWRIQASLEVAPTTT
jgi:hypothetical protein